MSKYTYYVFCNAAERTAQPVYTNKKEVMDREAEKWGKLNGYNAAIGPFKTRRGADFMAKHGYNNPNLQTVSDAERVAANNA